MLPTIIGLTPQINFPGKKQAVLEERLEYERCRKNALQQTKKLKIIIDSKINILGIYSSSYEFRKRRS